MKAGRRRRLNPRARPRRKCKRCYCGFVIKCTCYQRNNARQQRRNSHRWTMTVKIRKPFTFDENRQPAKPASPVKHGATAERKQVGARITAATYRQLKAKAALQG